MDPRFDPDFDDTEWTDEWSRVPIAEVPPGTYADGTRVVRRVLCEAEVFGRPYRLAVPLDCRFLYDRAGRLWMSTTPQERIMMYNNGRRSKGHTLVGGLGLGLYPQYAEVGAAGEATRFTVLERGLSVRAIVEPVLSTTLNAELTIRTGDVETLLAGQVVEQYDTIFLDTWDALDAALLPTVNRLRDLALRHLAPGGRVLLWGYAWMVRLYVEACQQLLVLPPARREGWLEAQIQAAPRVGPLLLPVAKRFRGEPIEDIGAALGWCRRFVATLTAG